MNINNLSLSDKIELLAIGKLSHLDFMLSTKDLSQTDKALLIDEVDDIIHKTSQPTKSTFQFIARLYKDNQDLNPVGHQKIWYNVSEVEKIKQARLDYYNATSQIIIQNLNRLKEIIQNKTDEKKPRLEVEPKLKTYFGLDKYQSKGLEKYIYSNIVGLREDELITKLSHLFRYLEKEIKPKFAKHKPFIEEIFAIGKIEVKKSFWERFETRKGLSPNLPADERKNISGYIDFYYQDNIEIEFIEP